MTNFRIPTPLKLFIAGILCLLSTYLGKPSLDAVSTIPFIIIIPALSYLIYRKNLYITLFCTLGGFFFSYAENSDISEAIIYSLVCTAFSALAVLALRLFFTGKIHKGDTKRNFYIAAASLFFLLLIIYLIFNGTFFGNLSSKALSKEYIRSTYQDEDFTVGTTYYSVLDRAYLTEFTFLDGEAYTALVSTDRGDDKIIDGYRDYCRSRLLDDGTERLSEILGNYVHENEDFAIRPRKIDTDDLILPSSRSEDYYDKMCYEIAFYGHFESSDDFASLCSKYLDFIPESFTYSEIVFYGLGRKERFEYSCRVLYGTDEISVANFNSQDFIRYRKNSDTHKYWSYLG